MAQILRNAKHDTCSEKPTQNYQQTPQFPSAVQRF